jgi:tetratricopeptide (TPR) repeat protein
MTGRTDIMHHKPFLAFLLLAFLWAGCDGFTDLAPISQRNVEEYYDQTRDFEVALNGAYDALQDDGTYGRNYWVLTEMRSDNTDQGDDVTGLARALAVINDFEESTTSGVIQTAWSASYRGVERTNVILDRLDTFDGDEAFENQIRGEALFIRSLLYYNLANTFGRIQLKLEPTPTSDPGSSAQQGIQVSAPSDVYTQIAADLELAQGLLPDAYPNDPQILSNEGPQHATSGAANALLGKVYLSLGQAGNAQTALERVVSSSADYELLPNYADLWGLANENNAESIFEVQFSTNNPNESSSFTNTFAPADYTVPGEGPLTGEGQAENRPTESMENAYEAGDERFAVSMGTQYTDANDGETNEARFIRKFESQPFADGQAGNNWPVLRYADVLLMLAEAVGGSDGTGTATDGRSGWDLINEVRNRAGLANVTQDNFYERLLQERRVELAFENHRWADLKRFDAQYGVGLNSTFDEGTVAPDRQLFPIPQREVDVAGLSQNDL